jgi:hypothetical protein
MKLIRLSPTQKVTIMYMCVQLHTDGAPYSCNCIITYKEHADLMAIRAF